MTLIEHLATAYQTARGWAVVFGGFASEVEARAGGSDPINAAYTRGVLEGREHVLARLRARGAGYTALADVIAEELKGG
jgi:hypothetical protein